MLTAAQRAAMDEAIKHSDISKSLDEAQSKWLSGTSPPTRTAAKHKHANKKKHGEQWPACLEVHLLTPRASSATGPTQTWGSVFDSVIAQTDRVALDAHDPMFDEEPVAPPPLKPAAPVADRVAGFKAAASELLDEYLSSGNVEEAVAALAGARLA